jgi:hypothetical protein
MIEPDRATPPATAGASIDEGETPGFSLAGRTVCMLF